MKDMLLIITFTVMLFAVAMNFKAVLMFLESLINLIFPILLGLVIAFVLNVPMTGFEKKIRRAQIKLDQKTVHKLSLLLTLICIVCIITLAFTMVIPALKSSIKSIYPLFEEKLPQIIKFLKSYQIDVTQLSNWVESIDLKNISENAGNIFGSAMQIASTTISGLTSTAFGFVIAIYILLSKSTLTLQVKKLTYAYCNKNVADYLCYLVRLVRDTYSKFLSGQCVEAIILGCLIFIAYSIFRIPYAGLVAFLTSLFAFVPYVGAFASCFIGAFLVMLVNPEKLFLSIIVYLVVQFIENQFIYPHVVGSSVGLPALWTLIAALIGGKLFGLPGIIFFIPLVSVLYTIMRNDIRSRLKEKNLKIVR